MLPRTKLIIGIGILIACIITIVLLVVFLNKPPKVSATVVSHTSTTDKVGNISTQTVYSDGSRQNVVSAPNGVSTTATIDPAGHTTTTSTADKVAAILSNPLLWESMAPQVGISILCATAKWLAKKQATLVADKIATQLLADIASKDATRALESLGMTIADHTADRAALSAASSAADAAGKAAVDAGVEAAEAAAKVGADIGIRASVAASTGPAVVFVEAAQLVIQTFTGYMDQFNLGGFSGQTSMTVLNSTRDGIRKLSKTTIEKYGDYPVVYGPIDTLYDSDKTSDKSVYNKILDDEALVFHQAAFKSILDGWANKTRKAMPPNSTDDQYRDYITANIDMNQNYRDARKSICNKNGGLWAAHPIAASNSYCSYDSTSCVAKWPQKKPGDTYFEYNTTDKLCEVSSSLMRSKCEALGNGVTYNLTTGSCNLTQSYCARFGNDGGIHNGDCVESSSEEIAETILGKSFVRSLVNIFGLGSYASCKPGEVTNAYLCTTDRCSPTQDKVGGLCYPKCDEANGFTRTADSDGNQVSGMCYKCDDGYSKSSAGMCARSSCPDPLEQGTGGGIGFCYPKCAAGRSSDGVSLCLLDCPAGYDTNPLTCIRNADTQTDTGVVASCPVGWDTTIDGPGGMCRQQCGPGRKMYGGLCYDNNVDTSLLWQVPHNGCNGSDSSNGTLTCCGNPQTDIFGDDFGCGHYYDTHQTCNPGYTLDAGSCWAVSGNVPQSKSLLEVGGCSDPNREKVDGMCYTKCSDGYTRSVAGSCLRGADIKDRDPQSRGAGQVILDVKMAQTQGPQAPQGISLHSTVRKRIADFPETTKADFEQSPVGAQVMLGLHSLENGDPLGLGMAMAGVMVGTNPAVVGLGIAPLTNIAATSIEGGVSNATGPISLY